MKKLILKLSAVVLSALLILNVVPIASISAETLQGVYTYGYEEEYTVYGAGNISRSQTIAHSGEYSLELDTETSWHPPIQAPLTNEALSISWHPLIIDFWMYIESPFDLSMLTDNMKVYTFNGVNWVNPANISSYPNVEITVDSNFIDNWCHVYVTLYNNTEYSVPYLYIMQSAGFGGKVYIDDVTITSLSWGTYAGCSAQTLKDVYEDNANNDVIVPGTVGATIPEPTRNGYTFDGWYTENTYENRVTAYAEGITTYYAKWVQGVDTYGYEEEYTVYGAGPISRSQTIAHSGEYSLELDTKASWAGNVQAPLTNEALSISWHPLIIDFWMYIESPFDLSMLTDNIKIYTFNGVNWMNPANISSYPNAEITVDSNFIDNWCHVYVTLYNNTEYSVPYLYIMQSAGFGGKVYIDDVTITSLSWGTYAGCSAQTLKDVYEDNANNDVIVPGTVGATIPEPTREGYAFEGWYTENTYENRVTTYAEDITTYYAKWSRIANIINTYTNLFDNEAGAEGTNAANYNSIVDIYNYYDYAPSAYTDDHTLLTTRTYKQSDFDQWRNQNTKAEPHIDPAYIAGNSEYVSYGKDSPGSMFLGYTTYTPAAYSRFRIWNNQSTNEPFVLDDNSKYRAKQVIEATNSTTIYRISFDYKAELPEGVDASLCYYNASGDEWYLGDTIDDTTSTELVSVKNTNGEWVFSGYTYVQSSAWRVASIALKAPLAYETIGTKVWIDNLKVEVTDATPESLVTVTFADGETTLETVKGLPGTEYSVTEPKKEGYIFAGWKDANNNELSSFVIPTANTTYYASWNVDGYKIINTYTNLFDNEAGAEGTNAANYNSIEDIYSYYDYAPSYDDSNTTITRNYKQTEFATWYHNLNVKAEPHIDPAYIAGNSEYVSYGKNSPGAMFLGYTSYTPMAYSRFRIWNNQSTNEPFALDDNSKYRAKQVIEATNSTTIYRISFDYKAELPEGVAASLCYYNASGDEWYLGDTIDDTTSTELVSVKNTNGEWVFSGYTYVQSSAWRVASIALKAELNNNSLGTKVWIDNLKVEVTDATSLDDMVKFTLMDGEDEISTVKGLYGLDSYVSDPEKIGYKFAGWADAEGNAVEIDEIFAEDKTYYALWEFVLLHLKGDLNSDNCIDARDLVRLKKYIAEVEGVTIDETNEFLSEYSENTFRLVALRVYLLQDKWIYPMTYAQNDASYRYVWGDEFNGNSLDMTKWEVQNHTSDVSDILFSDDEDVINVSDGALTLKSIAYTDSSDANIKYKVPETLNTAHQMNFKYGYIEMKAKIPLSIGATPAFWFKGCNGPSYVDALVTGECTDYMTEIDVFEILDRGTLTEALSDKRQITPNIHKWFGGNTNTNYNALKTNYIKELNEKDTGYHIYGFKWTDDAMVMSVDGVEYATFDLTKNFDSADTTDMSGFDDPMFMLISNGLRTPGNNNTDFASIADSDLPVEFSIDWIRMFQTENAEIYTAK